MTGWEEHLQNDLFLCQMGLQNLTQLITFVDQCVQIYNAAGVTRMYVCCYDF